jgi:hypothetical protein
MITTLLTITLLFLTTVYGEQSRTLLDGKWQLDQHHSIGSADDMMKMIGVDSIRRSIINSMDVTETYEVKETSFHMIRTTPYSMGNLDVVYQLGIAREENDIILGKVKHLVTFSNGRLQETLTRNSDGAVFVGVKKVNRDDENKIIYSMNFTLPGGRGKSSCVRYFLRR